MAMAGHISMDLEVLREASDWRQKQLPKCRKIVYISPSKAPLLRNGMRTGAVASRTLKLGISSAMQSQAHAEPGEAFRDIGIPPQIRLTTPEKWQSPHQTMDVRTLFLGSVKLVSVDGKVHLLGDACRWQSPGIGIVSLE
jgi:hypothetical protein